MVPNLSWMLRNGFDNRTEWNILLKWIIIAERLVEETYFLLKNIRVMKIFLL